MYNDKIRALSIDFLFKKNFETLPGETFATTAAITIIIPSVVKAEQSFALPILSREIQIACLA